MYTVVQKTPPIMSWKTVKNERFKQFLVHDVLKKFDTSAYAFVHNTTDL